MTARVIRALFVWPKYEDCPILATAWDDYDVDGNPSGWAEDKAKRIASFGDDLDPTMVREVTIALDADRIMSLFTPTEMIGEVK